MTAVPVRQVEFTDDMREFADRIHDIEGEDITVHIKDGTAMRFKTARERHCWADGFQFAVGLSREPEAILRWLDAYLDGKSADTIEDANASKALASRAIGEVRSEQWRARAIELGKRIDSWMNS